MEIKTGIDIVKISRFEKVKNNIMQGGKK